MTDPSKNDDLEVMAAGLALGLLEGAERADALRRQLEEPRFAERVRVWQEKTDRWLEEVDPHEAPTGALSSIETQLDKRSLNREVSSVTEDQRSDIVWRSWAITATAASLVLAVGLGLALVGPMDDPMAPRIATSGQPMQPANVAQIKDEAGAPLLSALYDPASGNLSLRLADLQQPEHGPELWIIPEDGIPRSLGLMDNERLTVTLSPELRSFLQDGATMAITIEPRRGAPHDAPTGDILGTAVMQEVPAGTI
jgi:anti-sigma-K factor RskA